MYQFLRWFAGWAVVDRNTRMPVKVCVALIDAQDMSDNKKAEASLKEARKWAEGERPHGWDEQFAA